MQNRELARDYIKRAEVRIKAVKLLLEEKSWADVVRESQEVVELALKALLRESGIAFPRTHDVSQILMVEKERLPVFLHKDLPILSGYSKQLRRDRELAFYGNEDLTPSQFYDEADALLALKMAEETVVKVKPAIIK